MKDDLTMEMHIYGGFVQVGSLGTSIISADTRITTSPGDIVLYSSNQIVIFYDSKINEFILNKVTSVYLRVNKLTY